MHQVMHTFSLLGNYYGSVAIGTVLVGLDGKESACSAGDLGSIPGLDPWAGKNPWRREWQPTVVFLPGEFHRQRSLARKE